MTVDNRVVERVVQRLLHELAVRPRENVLVLGLRTELFPFELPDQGVDRQYFYLDDQLGGTKIDRFVLPKLSINDMVDLAQGKSGSEISGKVLSLLLRGKRVEVFEYECDSYKQTVPPALSRKYNQDQSTLEEFGLIAVAVESVSNRTTNKLVSERDILDMKNKGIRRLRVDGTVIVTPLAAEEARRFGIQIQRNTRGA